MALSDETSWRDDVTASPGDEAVIAALQAEGALLRSQHAALTARIAELERRLGLNSSKSFKPPAPSRYGLNKLARVISLGEPSGKRLAG